MEILNIRFSNGEKIKIFSLSWVFERNQLLKNFYFFIVLEHQKAKETINGPFVVLIPIKKKKKQFDLVNDHIEENSD